LQWEAIKEAKSRGCKTYNFWGIAPEIKNPEDIKVSLHPWAGLSLFKMGFGGERKEYVKTQDLDVSPKYWLNYIIEVLRKHKRRL
jgi:lipid II:glycine glycyltransferase (peptidoglycan interpeptide bridge formation enzyme)